jgi:hypothetical protein
VPRLRSMSASNRTAPQWQLPLKVLIITPSMRLSIRKFTRSAHDDGQLEVLRVDSVPSL